MKLNNKGFSIIEILIGIFIFTLGLLSIFAIISSSMKLNDYSKNSIVASNLAREGIELVRNTRDSNYTGIYKWNKLPGTDVDNIFSTGTYYTIENKIDGLVDIQKILNFVEDKTKLSDMQNYRLYLDTNNNYTYKAGNKQTPYYRYIKFDDVEYMSGGTKTTIENALKLTSKVIWYQHGYHEVELNTVITDWQRQ